MMGSKFCHSWLFVLSFSVLNLIHTSIAEPVNVNSFRTFIHNVRSGDIKIMDEKTIEISDFNYDGEGPAAWFFVGKGREYVQEMVTLEGTVIPDENGKCSFLKKYDNEDITLTLPGDMKFSDYDYLSVYCLRFNHNFGYIRIPNEDMDDLSASKQPKKTLDECPQELAQGEAEDEEEEEEDEKK